MYMLLGIPQVHGKDAGNGDETTARRVWRQRKLRLRQCASCSYGGSGSCAQVLRLLLMQLLLLQLSC